VPGSHRTLLRAAVERLAGQASRAPAYARRSRDLAGALSLARGWVSTASAGDATPYTRHVLVVSDGVGAAGHTEVGRQVQALAAASVRLTAVGSSRLD